VFHDAGGGRFPIYRVTWDTYSIQTISCGLIPLVVAIATLIGMMIIMLHFDIVLTLLALAFPALAFDHQRYNRLMGDVSTE